MLELVCACSHVHVYDRSCFLACTHLLACVCVCVCVWYMHAFDCVCREFYLVPLLTFVHMMGVVSLFLLSRAGSIKNKWVLLSVELGTLTTSTQDTNFLLASPPSSHLNFILASPPYSHLSFLLASPP